MQTTRRTFLSALAGTALAGPPLAIAPVAVAATAPPPAVPPTPRPSAPPSQERHDPDLAATGECNCYECRDARWRRGSHPAHAASVIALRAADHALRRLIREYRGKWHDDICADADGFRFPIQVCAVSLDSELYTPDDFDQREAAALAAVAQGLPADAALLALYDALDALLDLGHGHCDGWDCHICGDADRAVYHVSGALNLIGQSVLTTPAVASRAVLSAQRKVARKVDPDTVYLHTARESYDPEHELTYAREILAICQRREAEHGSATL